MGRGDGVTTTDKISIEPGIFPDVPHHVYRQWRGVNFSTLKYRQHSERAYVHSRIRERAPTDDLVKGSALHTSVLEPRSFDEQYATWEGGTRRGKAWDQFVVEADAAGKQIIPQKHRDEVSSWAHFMRHDPLVGEQIVAMELREVSIVWVDEKTGLTCKGRIDGIGNTFIADLKTTCKETPELFERDGTSMFYPSQLAFYMDGYNQMSDKAAIKRAESLVLFKGSGEFPADTWVQEMTTEALQHGRILYRYWLNCVAELDPEKKPLGVTRGKRTYFTLPAWAESQLPLPGRATIEGDGIIF